MNLSDRGAAAAAAPQQLKAAALHHSSAGGHNVVDIGQQALEAKEQGIADVCRLLSSPEDLGRLEQFRAEVASKLSSARSALSSSATAQVEAMRYGMQLLDKSHRHIAKLRLCIDRIDELCGECTTLVENHDRIRALSHAHRNVSQVLEELGDIIDLPMRAEAVDALLAAGDSGLVAAFEGLTVLEGSANNIKEAWRRNAKKSSDLGELSAYLTQVGETMVAFERRLWSLARKYHALAQQSPRTLVDVSRIVEMQEQMDQHYITTKASYVRPRHWKERLFLEMEAGVATRFAPLLALCTHHGQPNASVKYDQAGNIVLREVRDYLGALTDVERVDWNGRPLPGAGDAELAVMQIREEATFDEDRWLETLLAGFIRLEQELAEAYDFVSPCFPPHYNIFDSIFQLYHVQFAQAMDVVGQVSPQLSTAGQLRLMQWVGGYQQTLRGLGVQEELVRLPVAPLSSNPEGVPGFALLLNSYTDRMDETMTQWYKSIVSQDLAGQPQQLGDGTLRTPGVIDFFRMLNEQVSVLEEISRGEVLLAVARRCLKLMQDFVATLKVLAEPPSAGAAAAAAGASGGDPSAQQRQQQELGFEMVCALVNNSVDCYNQSLEFTEHVQTLLDEGFRSQLDVEEVCRAFLDLAKAWSRRLIDIMYSDAGLVEQWQKMYCSSEWVSGQTTATIIATIGDYFNDITTFVEPGFSRRTCEGVLEELVRRSISYAVAAMDGGPAAAAAAMGVSGPDPGVTVLARMAQDERDVQVFFEQYVPLDKLVKRVSQLSGLRELLDSRDPEVIVMGYTAVVEIIPAVTPAVVDKLLAHRKGLSKVQVAEIGVQVKELHTKALKQQAAAGYGGSGRQLPPLMPQNTGGDDAGNKGWKFWKS